MVAEKGRGVSIFTYLPPSWGWGRGRRGHCGRPAPPSPPPPGGPGHQAAATAAQPATPTANQRWVNKVSTNEKWAIRHRPQAAATAARPATPTANQRWVNRVLTNEKQALTLSTRGDFAYHQSIRDDLTEFQPMRNNLSGHWNHIYRTRKRLTSRHYSR